MGLVKIAQREQLLVSLMERVLNTLTGRLNMKRTYSTIETRLEVADYITKTVEIESRNITVEREKNREENVMAKPVAFNYQEYEKLKVRNTIKQILDLEAARLYYRLCREQQKDRNSKRYYTLLNGDRLE